MQIDSRAIYKLLLSGRDATPEFMLEFLAGCRAPFGNLFGKPELVIWRMYYSNQEGNASAESLENIIGFELHREINYADGTQHPDLNRMAGKSMKDANSAFLELLLKRYNIKKLTEEPLFIETDSNLITFGSPSSNIFSRNNLGYNLKSSNRYELTRRSQNILDIPILFDLSDQIPSIYRGTRHGMPLIEPNWSVIVDGVKITPNIYIDANKSKLTEDFLILSCLPDLSTQENVDRLFSRYAVNEASILRDEPDPNLQHIADLERHFSAKIHLPVRKMLNIAGLHGPGTGAISSVFKDQNIMRRLKDEIINIGSPAYWQILIRVDKIEWVGERDVPASVDANSIIARKVTINEKIVKITTRRAFGFV